MARQSQSSPLTRKQVVDLYFLEHRAKMIDIAAFLDRVDRAQPDGEAEDFRVAAMRQALSLLTDGAGERSRRVLDAFRRLNDGPDPEVAWQRSCRRLPREWMRAFDSHEVHRPAHPHGLAHDR